MKSGDGLVPIWKMAEISPETRPMVCPVKIAVVDERVAWGDDPSVLQPARPARVKYGAPHSGMHWCRAW